MNILSQQTGISKEVDGNKIQVSEIDFVKLNEEIIDRILKESD